MDFYAKITNPEHILFLTTHIGPEFMKRSDFLKLRRPAASLLFLALAWTFGTGAAHLRTHPTEPGSPPSSQVSATAGSGWGLHFDEDGIRPDGNASPEELAAYNAFYVQDTEENVLYLTFDCGYENGNTGHILDTLKKHGAKAAFFVVGTYIESEPELVRRMADEGHIVGNHTWHHPDLSQTSDLSVFKKELTDVEDAYRKATEQDMPKYLRPPQGRYSSDSLQRAKDLGYKTIFWSLAYKDWDQNAQPTREEALDILTRRIHPGAIVLLHNTSSTNAAVLDELLTRWEEMGYDFRLLTELQ